MRHPLRAASFVLGALITVAGCSSGGGAAQTSDTSSGASQAAGADGTAGSTGAAPSSPTVCHGKSIPEVVARVEPSVVTVRTQKGLGSGIAYRKNLIVTDQHVVAVQEGQPQVVSSVQVALADGSTITGRVVGSDLATDLAVVKVTRDLSPLPFQSTLPQPGETVLAMGSPLGFSSSVSEGIVSALGRDLPGSQSSLPLVDLIQTDAAISPGNSGGALLDVCGRVVGVNEAYIPPQAGAVSLGFATPSVVAANIADQLAKDGKAVHPFLGVQLTNLSPQDAQALSTPVKAGVVVVAVVSGGPAAKAGIRRGDVITAVAGHRVSNYAELLGEVRATRPGQTIEVRVNRHGRNQTFQVKVGAH